jgi:hypothetical protein
MFADVPSRAALRVVLWLAAVCALPAAADPGARCISLRTNCPGKGWVTSSCNETNPCGTSATGATTNEEAARALGTALGKLMACKLFGQGCPGHADDSSARANYYGLSATQRQRLVEAIAEEEAASAAAQRRVSAVLGGGSTGGLALRNLDAAPEKRVGDIDAAMAAERARIINSMNALAKRLEWDAGEQSRLARALESLAPDGDPDATGTQIRRTWGAVLARGQDADLARRAATGSGPGFPGAGTQSFEDCAIFALANAAGLPYSIVAARATELIRQGDWRDAAARANPQKAIEQRGLTGGEVIMMAEALGQAEVVRSADFARTLREGRRLMLNVVPQDGDTRSGHAVVLSRVFQHGGETWYEMMDSNQGARQRLYLSAKELDTMLQETGVAFRPEPGRTPGLLR